MGKNIIIKIAIPVVVVILFTSGYFLFFTPEPVEETEEKEITREEKEAQLIEEGRTLAEEWIENYSPTYLYDGSGLTFENGWVNYGMEEEFIEEEDFSEEMFIYENIKEDEEFVELMFQFRSEMTGYGDRDEKTIVEATTLYRMFVIVQEGEVKVAITDNVFDEKKGEFLSREEEPEFTQMKVFFAKEGEEGVFPVGRGVLDKPHDNTPIESIKVLIAGPTERERKEGFFSLVNSDTTLRAFARRNSVARVNLSGDIEKGIESADEITLVREQIKSTLLQFSGIDDVEIMVDGDTENIFR